MNEPDMEGEVGGNTLLCNQCGKELHFTDDGTLDYDLRIEFDEFGQPHGHLCLISSLVLAKFKMKKLVKSFWTAACEGRKSSVYLDKVKTVIGTAKHTVKDIKDRRRVFLPPKDWRGRTCHLTWCSRGFFTKSKAKL